MRLLKVALAGIRRFEESDALLVADRLVAIVGPNEAGKSSLLQAIDQIDQWNTPLPAKLATRQCNVTPTIRALFELDDEDVDAVEHIHNSDGVKRLWVTRTMTGTTWRLERHPERDNGPRRRTTSDLALVSTFDEVEDALADPENPLNRDIWSTAMSLASSPAASLTEDERSALSTVADLLNDVLEYAPDETAEELQGEESNKPASTAESQSEAQASFEDARSAAVDGLRSLVAAEAQPSPSQQIVTILRDRLPTIVEFDDDDRDLQSEYDLQELGEQLPPALDNVAALAGLSLIRLRQAIEAGDHGTVRLIKEDANARLREFFDETYKQSDVCLQLDTDGFIVRLLVRSEGGEDFVEITERSSGFRWFVALVAFLARHEHSRPLVLIDEIETHLHYGAQADVIDLLDRQTVARQVIYTTHSAGALPPDLGRGTRAVVPVVGRQRSEIKNSFWTSGPGFTPLLFGLGASTLPFSIPRFLIVAEGASDAILLPTLIRMSTELAALPYRIAPGLSNTPVDELSKLDEEGGRVCYLVDGDHGGGIHRSNLLSAGIDPSKILDLSTIAAQEVTPEDLVQMAAFVSAVNNEGQPFWRGATITSDDLPERGRSRALEEWCKANSLPLVSKVRVAQNLIATTWLDLEADRPDSNDVDSLMSSEGRAWSRELHGAACAAMQLPANDRQR